MNSEWDCPNCGKRGEVHYEVDNLSSVIFELVKQAHLKVSPTCSNKYLRLRTSAPTFNPIRALAELHGNGHKEKAHGSQSRAEGACHFICPPLPQVLFIIESITD